MVATQIDWTSIEGKPSGELEEFIRIPPGVWSGNLVSAQYKVEEIESKREPGEKWEARQVLFEFIAATMENGDFEAAEGMSEQNKVEERKWYRFDLRKRTDLSNVEAFLKELGCYDPKLPTIARDDQQTNLDLVAKKTPKVTAELQAYTDSRDRPNIRIAQIMVPNGAA